MASRVKLIREKIRIGFIVVVSVVVVVFLLLRLRHCFGAAKSHNCSLLCLGAFLLHAVNTPPLAKPLHVFYRSQLSGLSGASQIEMLNRPLAESLDKLPMRLAC